MGAFLFSKTSISRLQCSGIGVYYKCQKGRARERNPKMKKVDYEQLTNDAVKALIKKHLAWSGSDKEMPSRDLDNVRGRFIKACLKGVDGWELMSEDEKQEAFGFWGRRFDKVAAEADRKWEEGIKVMLDL